MKRKTIITSLFLVLSFCFVNGQDKRTDYFNIEWKKCSKELAVYYRKVYQDSSKMWIVKDYYMNGVLQMEGKFSDRKLKTQQGTAVYYHFNGRISSTGQFLDNKKIGFWKDYFSNGNLTAEGNMLNGENDSVWTYYHLNGAIMGKKNFINGKAEGESKWYYESGSICEIAIYEHDEIMSKINYDENGSVVESVEEDCDVEYLGGNDKMMILLRENLQYPYDLQLKGIQGIVLFHFIVRKDGSIDNLQFKKSDESLFNIEALRVFRLIKQMKPAWNHGQAVDSECTLPISFRLRLQ